MTGNRLVFTNPFALLVDKIAFSVLAYCDGCEPLLVVNTHRIVFHRQDGIALVIHESVLIVLLDYQYVVFLSWYDTLILHRQYYFSVGSDCSFMGFLVFWVGFAHDDHITEVTVHHMGVFGRCDYLALCVHDAEVSLFAEGDAVL